MFGTNVPLLMKMITQELELEIAYRSKKAERKFYAITDRQPIEQEIYELVQASTDRARIAEQQAAEAKRREYLIFVTDEIMRNMADLGVTIFGPQITRDMYKKLMDPADTQKLSCKDRRILQVTPQDLDVLHFSCNNPLSDEIWDYLLGKDLLTCLWKVSEGDTRSIDEILAKYVHDCTKPQTMVDDFGNVIDQSLPSLLPPLEIEIKEEEDKEAEENLDEEEEEEAGEDDIMGDLLGDMELPSEYGEDEGEEGTEVEEKVELKPKIEIPKKILTIPAVWAPGNCRTMAAAIYLFYRWHTGTFLPPDPVPDPPHLALAFEAYKRKDIAEVCEKYKEDILAYGYFTSADPETAELISNTTTLYEKKPFQVTDKLVLKVAKKTSHTVLTLATYGPCYVSSNTVEGERDCKKFFPEGYITEADAQKKEEEEKGKKKKQKKKKKAAADETEEIAQEATDETHEGGEAVGEEEEGKKQTTEPIAPSPSQMITEASGQDIKPVAGEGGETEGEGAAEEAAGEAAETPKEGE